MVELGGCLAPEDEGDAAASATRVSKHQLPLLQISEIIWRIPSKGSMAPPPSPPPQIGVKNEKQNLENSSGGHLKTLQGPLIFFYLTLSVFLGS